MVFKLNGISLQQAMESHHVMEQEELQSDLLQEKTLQATENYQILNPYQMFQWAKQNIAEIIFFYVADQKVSKNVKTYQLEQKYLNCTTVSGTRFPHCFIPLSQGSPNISSSKPCIDFFGPPWVKAKNIVCKKQLINNYKRSKDLFFLEITMISFF